MCGIFAYLNYNVNRERRYILQVLFNGLRRLEYRGYDSAGISIDAAAATNHRPLVFRQEGKIESLVKSVYEGGPPKFFPFNSASSSHKQNGYSGSSGVRIGSVQSFVF